MQKTLLQNIRDPEWRNSLSIVQHTILAFGIGAVVVIILALFAVMWKLMAVFAVMLLVGEAILYMLKRLDR